jgi:hypothetical protein
MASYELREFEWLSSDCSPTSRAVLAGEVCELGV